MMKRKTTFHGIAGAAVLSGALAFGACSSGTPVGTASTISTTSQAAQQQAQMVLQHVQSQIQENAFGAAQTNSTTTINSSLGKITTTSQGTTQFSPFALNWQTTTNIAGNTIHSHEIVTNGNLYISTQGNQYHMYSLSQLASLANGSSATSTDEIANDVEASVGLSLQNFLQLTNARLVCGNNSGATQSTVGSLSTTSTNTSTQVCTVPWSASTLNGQNNGISISNGKVSRAYEIQGSDAQVVNSAAGVSTNAAAASTETIYVAADGSYHPLAVTFGSGAGAAGSAASVTSTTVFSQWNQGASQISAPPADQVANG